MSDFARLIICRDLHSARRLRHFRPQVSCRCILASDDPKVQEAAKEYLWIDEICWIEQMESLYCVAEDVLRLTETVNGWLKSLAGDPHGFSEELLFFTRHVEGGMTTQRIQDLLLLIRSYHFLLDTHGITDVVLIVRHGMSWEDEVLMEICRSRGIAPQVAGNFFWEASIRGLKSNLEIAARAVYYAANVFRIRGSGRSPAKKSQTDPKEIIFQLCSSSYKHVKSTVPLMTALSRKGYKPVALCWHSNERYTRESAADQIRREGLKAEELEKWVSLSDHFRSVIGFFYTWKKTKDKKKEFLTHPNLNYLSVPLGGLLWPSIRFFIATELPQSYRIFQALKRYFKCHEPIAVKLWGATALKEGTFAWKSLSSEKRPLFFHYEGGIYLADYPYRKPDPSVDLLFVEGPINKRLLEKNGFVPSGKIEICGQTKNEEVEDFRKKNDRAQSRLYLKIPAVFSLYILFDSNMVQSGFISGREQIVRLDALLKFARAHPSVALMVKPHPGHRAGALEDMIRSGNGFKNVFLINKRILPYQALNAADLLITKFSTLGIEAMLFECPVVCWALDNEHRFNIYRQAADDIVTLEGLQSLLHKLVTDDVFKRQWRHERLEKQKNFLDEYFCKMEESPSAYQASVLDRYLRARGSV